MSQPEISHRCPACGVSVRDSDALFCYECGKPLSSKAKKSEPAETGEVLSEVADQPQAAPVAEETVSDSKPDGEAISPVAEPVVAAADKPPETKSDTALKMDDSTSTPPAASRGDKTR